MAWRKKIERCLLGSHPEEGVDCFGTVGSVLIPVGRDPASGAETLVLTKRTLSVQTHKGQVSFPGGIREPEDSNLLCTALRETAEEIGLSPEAVTILGSLEPIHTRGALPVYSWVGYFDLPYPFSLSGNEVEKLLFLPLDRLMAEGLKDCEVPLDGLNYQSVGIEVEDELVWGATARILEQLRNRILGSDQS